MAKRKKYMSYVVTIIVALLVCVLLGSIRFIEDMRQSDVKLSDIKPLDDIRKSGKDLSDARIEVIVNSWGPISFTKVVEIRFPDGTWINIGWWRTKGKTPQIELSWLISESTSTTLYKQITLYFVDGHWKLVSHIFYVTIPLPP